MTVMYIGNGKKEEDGYSMCRTLGIVMTSAYPIPNLLRPSNIYAHIQLSVSGATALCEFLIPLGPLLHQSHGKHAIQAKDQGEKPQHVDPHGGGCWFEWLNALHCKAHKGCPIQDVEKLSRYDI